MTLSVCLSGAMVFKIYTSFESYNKFRIQVVLGNEVILFAEDVQEKKYSNKNFKQLQEFREKLEPENRKLLLSDYIQSYSEKNKFLTNKKLARFIANENHFKQFVFQGTEHILKEIQYYGVITLAILFLTALFIYQFVNWQIIKPILNLNNKMIDFLNEKYTYQFIVPKNDEIGRLQSTFNSLAQQTLTNIDQLKELDRAKSEFLSIASHELRTPLTSIKGSLGLLHQGIAGPLAEPVSQLVSIANEETDRLIRLINDILDLTKIEAKKLELKKEWTPLEDLITKTFRSLEGFCAQSQVTLHFKHEAPYLINVDRDRFQQILTNLLSNAIKYSPSQGRVEVFVHRSENGKLQINVQDEGKGIAPQDQQIIFEQFRQATSPQNPLVKGTGLGLAIAKALTEQHEGEIGVDSTVGFGSTFYFTIKDWKLDMTDSKVKIKIMAA